MVQQDGTYSTKKQNASAALHFLDFVDKWPVFVTGDHKDTINYLSAVNLTVNWCELVAHVAVDI